jgi:putative PIN family toxin of toxin-antitoxin system
VRVVIDTNIAISGLFWQGAPREVLELARSSSIRLYLSSDLLQELDEVLHRPKFAIRIARTNQSIETILQNFAALCTVITAPPLPQPVASDADDDAVLACAVAIDAAVIVSGDRHLLDLVTYAGIPIFAAHHFLQWAEARLSS